MRIISRTRLVEFWKKHGNAKAALSHWHGLVKAARWSNITEVRKTFPHADLVKVASGETVVVFNAGGNNVRVVCAIKYDFKTIYVLRVMTHAEYDRDSWKDQL